MEVSWMIGAVAVIAGAIAAVSGFGIGSLLTPVLIISMPTADAVAVIAIPHAVATTVRWMRLRGDVDPPTFRQFGLASALGGLAGALLQSRLGSSVLTVVLASLLLLAGVAELAGRSVPLPRTPVWRLLGGTLSGLFGGLVGNQGGIRAAALLGFRLSPRQIVATATASALMVDAVRVPIYLASAGSVIAATTRLWLMIAAGVTIGTFIGVPVLSRIPAPLYRRLLGGLLVLLALALLAAPAWRRSEPGRAAPALAAHARCCRESRGNRTRARARDASARDDRAWRGVAGGCCGAIRR
jgi:uncharacterized membrane protein YfcA